MNANWLNSCLQQLNGARVAVFGDFCLDAYWVIAADESELSVETHLSVRRVRQQRYSLGGAANVVANLVDLGVKSVLPLGLIGEDLFGKLMLEMFQNLGVNTEGLLSCQSDWQTMVFGKPCIGDVEQNRLDFGGFNSISDSSIELLAEELDRVCPRVDVVILNQQVPAGVTVPKMIERINAVVAKHPNCRFIVDSRHRAELFRGVSLKANTHEAARLVGEPRLLDEHITADQAQDFAERLFQRVSQPVFITRGENGIIVVDGTGASRIPGIQIIDPIDPVGAGDTTIATLAAALASRSDPQTAARLANIAASVTVRKLQVTGTATPEEILAVGPDPDYVYLPELAEDPRRADYYNHTEIEIVRTLPADLNIGHAIFDHDGTISTLRQGWEQVMEPMMVRAILGQKFEDADEVLYHKVVSAVRRFIDKTTGIQTLVQMQGLAQLVRQFGCVPEKDVLDMHGYKAIYNQALLEMVRVRVDKLNQGELNTEDFQIKNARQALEKLHQSGVKLYLASGTDQDDAVAEAEALGYAHLFEGRIYGAVGDTKVEAKREVLEQIIRQHRLSGSEFATFGDGPVEIRETRKRNGVAVGVASDEVRRFGLNPAKRSRLIRAGADLIVPDFTQLPTLLDLLDLQ